MCARRPKSQTCPGLHQEKRGQQGEGGDSATLPCSGETPPEVLCPALEPSAQERPGAVGAGPEEATKMIQGLQHLSCEGRLRSWDCSAGRREGCGETCGSLPVN